MGQCPSGICLLLLLLGLHDNSGKGLFIYYVIADLGGWGGVIGLLHFGPLPQKINGKSVKLAVPAILLNLVHVSTLFFVIDIHQIYMLISLFPTPFDHFYFHTALELKGFTVKLS